MINYTKILYSNNKDYLFNLNIDEFIYLVSLVPDIQIQDNKIIYKGRGGYFNYVIKSYNNLIKDSDNQDEIKRRFFNEDYDRIKEQLLEFSELNKDLSQLKYSFDNLYKVLNGDKIIEPIYHKWLKIKNKLIPNEDYIQVYKDEDYIVLIPINYDYYTKLVDDTNYCTKSFNTFFKYSYFKNNPLYLIIPKNPSPLQEIYQIHIQSNQYMDYLDNQININNHKIKNIIDYIKEYNQSLDWINIKYKIKIKPQYYNQLLILASKYGDLKLAQYLIENGADINIQNIVGYTALIWASTEGHLDIVKLLVEKGAKINLQNKDGWTTLMWVSSYGYLEIVKVLVEKGGDINIQNNGGNTALILASEKGHLEIVKVLVENGANMDLQNQYGRTALMWASFKGHLEVVKCLVENGAKIDLQNKWGYTALDLAKNQEIKEYLMSK